MMPGVAIPHAPPILLDMAKVKRISVAPVRRMAEARGIDNPYALARELKISYPTARKWWFDEDQSAVDLATIIKVCNYFGVLPGAVFEAELED